MIVKDEEAWLSDCLASVRAIADEIVVADTGSTDSTPEIARRFGAKVHSVPWTDDFADARNRGMAFAKSDWLLHLDADEVLDEGGAGRIRAIVEQDGAGADAIEVTLANYCSESRSWRWVPVALGDRMARGHPGYIAVQLVRLFRNHRGVEYREAVHENIAESLRERGLKVRREPVVIHHYGFGARPKGPGPKDYFYLKLNRKKVRDRPTDAKSWQDLGAQLIAVGEFDQGEAACRRALELCPDFIDAAASLANVLLIRNALDEAREALEPFAVGEGASPHMATALAVVHMMQGRIAEARDLLRWVAEAAPAAVIARLYLARVLDLTGDVSGAREQLRHAMSVAPGLTEIRDRLAAHDLREAGEACCIQGDPRAALEKFVQALRLDPEDPLIHNGLGVVLTQMGLLDKAKESFTRALRFAPAFTEARANLQHLDRGGAGPETSSSDEPR